MSSQNNNNNTGNVRSNTGNVSSESTKLQISLSAKKLKNISGGLFGRNTSDPFAIVTVRGDDPDNNTSVYIAGHTNVAYDELSPTWANVIKIDGYKFGRLLFIEVGIYDFDVKKSTSTTNNERSLSSKDSKYSYDIIDNDIKTTIQAQSTSSQSSMVSHLVKNKQQRQQTEFPHKIMGSALFEVGEILGSRGNSCSKKLQTGGELCIHIEKNTDDTTTTSNNKRNGSGKLRLKLSGLDLKFSGGSSSFINGSNFLRTSIAATATPSLSPFYEIYRRVRKPTGEVGWNKIFKSNVIRNNVNPLWDDCLIDLDTLCNGNINRIIKIVLWSQRRSSGRGHLLIGEYKCKVSDLLDVVGNYLSLDESDEKTILSSRTTGSSTLPTIGGQTMAASSSTISSTKKDVGTIVVVESEIINSNIMTNLAEEEQQQQQTSSNQNVILSNNNDNITDISSYSTNTINSSIPSNIGFQSRPEFIDYITGGCQINLAVAIDFTSSNGNPLEEGSLHDVKALTSHQQFNDYEKAIYAVGSILAKYDYDSKFPIWGFGAKYNGVLHNCFQCGSQQEVDGVDGMLSAYRSVFQTPLTMSSPTIITDVIKQASSYAKYSQQQASADNVDELSYTILLILTAGDVDNVEETKKLLNDVAKSPLSVVIVGIGNANFSGMEFLDGDLDIGGNHGGHGEEEDIDITQFVRFNDYNSVSKLTEAVLDEIPDQLVDYFYTRHNILPGKTRKFNNNNKSSINTSDKGSNVSEADDDDRTSHFLSNVNYRNNNMSNNGTNSYDSDDHEEEDFYA